MSIAIRWQINTELPCWEIGRQPRKISQPEDMALLRHVRRCPFSSSKILRDNWIPNRAISTQTLRNRLKTAEY